MEEQKVYKSPPPVPGLKKFRIDACVAAFHDDQGRTLEDIPQGLVWRLYDALDNLVASRAGSFAIARDILDSLHIKEPENG